MAVFVKVGTEIPCAFNRVKAGSTFMVVKGYKNNHGEISDFNLVFHFSYRNAVKKALNIWRQHRSNSIIQEEAKTQLIASYLRSLDRGDHSKPMFSDHALSTPYARTVDVNGRVIDGVKYHVRNKELHLTGLLISKRVLSPGVYPVENKNALTIEKDKLIALTSLANYRQFKLVDGRFQSIHVDKMTLTQDSLARKMA